jgi:hypothetical protein
MKFFAGILKRMRVAGSLNACAWRIEESKYQRHGQIEYGWDRKARLMFLRRFFAQPSRTVNAKRDEAA